MKKFIVFLLIGFFIALIKAQEQFTLVGSRTIQHGSQYNLLIDSLKLDGDTTVIMKLKGTQENDIKIVKSNDQGYAQLVKFNLDEPFLSKNYTLSILSHRDGMCTSDEIPIYPIRKEYSVFIQMDKPLYKPKDTVNFRILLLDQNTMPFAPNNLKVAITEASGEIIREFNSKNEGMVKMGIYENTFEIHESPNLGMWTISVEVNERKNEIIKKNFEVKEYVLPLVNVNISSSSYLLHTDTLLRLTISAKYSFNMLAKGSADVSVKVYDTNGVLKHTVSKKVNIVTMKIVDFDVARDLKIKKDDPNRIINVTVDFIDDLTGKKFQRVKEVRIRRKDSFYIRLYHPNTFVPGNNYEFAVSIKDFDGIPQHSMAYEVKMKCEYNNNNYELNQPSFLYKGFARFRWIVPADVTGMKITVDYRDSRKIFEVSPGSDARNDNFEISIADKHLSLKKTIKVNLKSVSRIGIINYAVVGRKGIADGKNINCKSSDKCEFLITPNENMLPSSSLIVYFVNSDGFLVYDTVKMHFKELSSNHLILSVDKNEVKPGKKVKLTMNSSPNSYVALLGIDEALTFLVMGNDIDDEMIAEDLLAYGHTNYIISNKNTKIIENSFVYSQNYKNIHKCTDAEQVLINEANPDIDVRFMEEISNRFGEDKPTADYGTTDDDDDDDDPDEPRVRKDFREVFIYDSIQIDDSGKALRSFKMPDKITSWLVTGIAMNKMKGFALAEPIKVVTTMEMFVKLHLPYSIKFGEVLKVEATVFNFVASRSAKKVDVTMIAGDNFEFIKFENCQPRAMSEDSMTATLSIEQNSAQTTFFHIRALKSGIIKIKVIAKTIDMQDTVEQTLIVEHEGTTYYDPKEYHIDLANKTEHSQRIDYSPSVMMVPNSMKFYGSVASSIIPVPLVQRATAGQDFFTNLAPDARDCREQRFAKISLNTQVFKFLKERNLLTPTLRAQTMNYIATTYQEVLQYRNTRDGSYPLWNSDSDHVWMTAYVSRIFGQIRNNQMTHINDELITKALEYLVIKQGKNGGYEKYNSLSQQYMQSKLKPQGVTMTAFVLLTFLENKQWQDGKHADTILNGLRYISENVASANSNYATAISAYAFALADRKDDAENLLTTLNKDAIVSGNYKYWSDRGQTCSSTEICIDITSYALLAHAKLKKLREAVPLENYLISKRNIYGHHGPTHCTVLALNALAEIGKYDKIEVFKANVEFKTNLNDIYKWTIDGSNLETNDIKELNPNARTIWINAKKTEGSGKCIAMIESQFKRREEDVQKQFDLDVHVVSKAARQAKIKFCSRFITDNIIENAAMTVMEIELPSGYIYDHENDLKAQNLEKFQKVELKDLKTKAILYFDSFTNVTVCPTLNLIRMNEVREEKKCAAKIFDYNSEMKYRATTFYGINRDNDCS